MSKEIKVCKNLKCIDNKFTFLNEEQLKELKETVCKVSCESKCEKKYFQTDEDLFGKRIILSDDDELFDADPNCDHYVVGGNGLHCVHCGGWFCY